MGAIKEYTDTLALLGLILSVGGLYVSALAMRDLKRVINTFDEFAYRLINLIEEVKPAGTSEEVRGLVRIMAYTPLPGAIALRTSLYHSLRQKIVTNENIIDVTCLDKSSFEKWNKGNLGKPTPNGEVSDDEIEDVERDFSNLIDALEALRRIPVADDEVSGEEVKEVHGLVTGPAHLFPKFFVYFTDNRALVINMLYYPFDDAKTQPVFVRKNPTEVIGFETTDTSTIRKIRGIHDEVRKEIVKLKRMQDNAMKIKAATEENVDPNLASAQRAFEIAIAPARHNYDETISAARHAYQESTARAWRTYEESAATARGAYEEAQAQAFLGGKPD
jgi:hypothetical protein